MRLNKKTRTDEQMIRELMDVEVNIRIKIKNNPSHLQLKNPIANNGEQLKTQDRFGLSD